ncbi:MAG: hypothetical protein ACKPKO_59195, partial [Candidatus Fonsibacter sp.]
PPKPKSREATKTTKEPKEKRPRGRPKKVQTEEPKEKKPKGRPRIYEERTILKPKDPEYFKNTIRILPNLNGKQKR